MLQCNFWNCSGSSESLHLCLEFWKIKFFCLTLWHSWLSRTATYIISKSVLQFILGHEHVLWSRKTALHIFIIIDYAGKICNILWRFSCCRGKERHISYTYVLKLKYNIQRQILTFDNLPTWSWDNPMPCLSTMHWYQLFCSVAFCIINAAVYWSIIWKWTCFYFRFVGFHCCLSFENNS